MIGLVLVTHGKLAAELIAAMEHIVGRQARLSSVFIGPDDDIERRKRDILNAAKETDQGEGVLILTDMFGGTPSNLAIAAMKEAKLEVVSGVNLPMLITLAALRAKGDLSLKELALQAQQAGRKYIHVASQILREGEEEP